MVKRFLTFFVLCSLAIIVNAQMYVQNGNFETWTFDGDNLPNNWNSFQTADGDWASLGYSSDNRQVKKQAYSKDFSGPNGETSGNCCAIWARSVWGVVAQGNLTTGRVHAGATSATAKNNYNYSDIDGTGGEGITNPGAMKFTGKPDSIVAWVKFVPKKELSENNTAKLNATIHTANEYISYGLPKYDEADDTNKGYVVGMATNAIGYYKDSNNNYLWQRLSAPFAYKSTEKEPAYILIDVATNGYPGQGTANDYLYVDNIEMVYNYTEPLFVNIKNLEEGEIVGESTTSSTKQVSVGWNGDGTVNFRLSNFVLQGEDDNMPVGNISIDNLPVTNDKTFTFNGIINIKNGDSTSPMWFGPFLGDIPVVLNGKFNEDYSKVYVSLDIDMTSDDDDDGSRDGENGQKVKVHLGYDRAVLSVSDAKYGTFAAPVDITLPEGVTAYKVASVDNTGVLELTKAADAGETLAAGTAVVVASESPASAEAYFYTTETRTTTDLLTGVYEPTDITSGYVLQNLDNKVAFYQVSSTDPITVPANRCYLTAPAGSVKALAFPDGTLTSISEIQAADEKAVIYDLSGRRVSKATKGIYIINGKKVIK